jgi:thioesterase III
MTWFSSWLLHLAIACLPLEIQVRLADLDPRGHVSDAKYVEYMHNGRLDWLAKHSLPSESLEKAGCVLVVVHVDLDYRSPSTWGDVVVITTDVEELGERTLVFRQFVTKRDGTILADGRVTMVAIDPAAKRSRPIPKALKCAAGF